ncbi:MAG TPA: FecR domain-containing protein [Steroidobacteraceae bacterium]
MTTPLNSDRLSSEAIDWFLKFQESARGKPPPRGFSEWLVRSPEHIQEYLDIACVWDVLNVPPEGEYETAALIEAMKGHHEPDNIVRLQDRFGTRPRPLHTQPLPPRSKSATWAACALLVSGVLLAYVRWISATEFSTHIGEQHSVTLQDGSVIFLNTDSKVEVRWSASERHIDLLRGEARFQVARNPTRPFIVATADAQVRALGTAFNVRSDAHSTQVAVMEGEVEVTLTKEAEPARQADREPPAPGAHLPSFHPSSNLRLAAGERAAVTSTGIEPNTGPSIESVAAWPQRRLVFRGETLGTIVNEFNRYRTQPLVLDDSQLAQLEISGAFDLNDPESLVAYLKTFETVQVERPFDGSEHLSRVPVP